MFDSILKIFTYLKPFLLELGLSKSTAIYMSLFINIAILIVIVYVMYFVFRFVLVTLMAIIAKKTKTKFDDLLISNKTSVYISHLIPLLFTYQAAPVILDDFQYWEAVFGKLTGIYIVLLILWIIRTILNAVKDYLKQKPEYSDKPFDSYIQFIMFMLWTFGIIYLILFLFNTKISTLIATFGAVSAIIILIFRDTILGLAVL